MSQPLRFSWRREGQTAFALAKNTVKLAPDRFLAVYATIVVVVLGLLEIGESEFPQFVHDAPLARGFGVLGMLVVAILPTFLLCKRDPELYARIVTANVDSSVALRYLARMALRIIRKVEMGSGERHQTLVKHERQFQVLERAKVDLAQRFGLTPRVFCDQFFRFSPAIFRDRVTKLALNDAVVPARAWEDQTLRQHSRRYKLAQQSHRILLWIEDVAEHLHRLSESGLPFHKVEALFLAESTSGSVQQLAQILEESKLSDRDTRLLFDLIGAYRGRSLFRRLLTLTLLHADARLEKDPEELPKLISRVRRLLRAERGQTPEPYQLRHLVGWSREISGYVQKCRQPLWEQLRHHLRLKLDITHEGGHLYVVVDSYSRAVRTALRVAVPNDERIKVFFLLGDNPASEFGPRLLHHVVEWEDWEENANQVERISGDIELLGSLVQESDGLVGLSGAAGIFAQDGIYSTSKPSVWEAVKDLADGRRARSFSRVALAGSYKLDWERFWPCFTQGLFSKQLWLRPELEALGLTEDTLRQSRDSLTGGLYLHQPVQLLSEMPVEEFGDERTDRSARARAG